MFKPEDIVELKITAKDLQTILELVGQGSYNIVQPIINNIISQVEAQKPNGTA